LKVKNSVSMARITQIMDLLMLAPDIQENVLIGNVGLRLRALLPIRARPEHRTAAAGLLR
jgi:hypothetical protein